MNQAEKRRLHAMGEVAAGVAQELRNPPFGISSAAQLLRFRVKDDPVVEKNVGRILREVERLNNLASALLEYGRPSPIHLESASPESVWDDVIAVQRGKLESRALLLHRSRVDAARCAIDAKQLGEAFAHVLVNAINAAPEGSDLTLSSAMLANGDWSCQLRNGGAPIPPDALSHVFDMFFTTTPGVAGMGLTLSQRIMQEHDGTITLSSSAESGTVATFTLPPASSPYR